MIVLCEEIGAERQSGNLIFIPKAPNAPGYLVDSNASYSFAKLHYKPNA